MVYKAHIEHVIEDITAERGGLSLAMRDYVSPCGTTACIAGFAALRAGLPMRAMQAAVNEGTGGSVIHRLARDYLGLTDAQANALFYAYDDEDEAGQTLRTLRHLAETGEVDWAVRAQAQAWYGLPPRNQPYRSFP